MLIGGAVCTVLYFTILEPWTVPGTDAQFVTALEPNLFADDVLVLSRHNDAQVGWLVRCADPDAPGLFVVARVMAKAGTTVDIQGGVLRLDNRSPSAPMRCEQASKTVRHPLTQEEIELDCSDEDFAGTSHEILTKKISEKDTHLVVDGGHVFLASDNRAMHMDSRDFGQIDVNTCQHILFRLWSTDDKHRFSLVW